MSKDNDLIDIGRVISDAKDELRRAARLALQMTDEIPDGAWPAMDILIEQLDAVNVILNELPGTEIQEAINAAKVYLDDLADRADGLSY